MFFAKIKLISKIKIVPKDIESRKICNKITVAESSPEVINIIFIFSRASRGHSPTT